MDSEVPLPLGHHFVGMPFWFEFERTCIFFPNKFGTEGWNRTNVEGFKDLRPATERPRHPGCGGGIRTRDELVNSQLPYHLATPQKTKSSVLSHRVLIDSAVHHRRPSHRK